MRSCLRLASFALVAALSAPALDAQTPIPPVRADHPAIKAALETIKADNAWTIEQQVSICEIPAPPFKEERRAAEMKRRFESLGLSNVRIDSIGNVIGEYRGEGDGPTVMVNAHLDTVFPEDTDVAVTRAGTLLKGPGIGDDCRGLATILAVARAFKLAKVQTNGTILFIANVGEEGPGNLRGVRYLFRKPPTRIDYVVAVDGTGLGIVTGAVGSNRYKVSFKGPGGHSYGAFGMPSPIHAMGRAIAKMADMRVPTSPKTTFNVGIVEGGTSVNTISPLGAMDVDLRSESAEELARLDATFRKAVADGLKEENDRWPESKAKVTVDIEDRGVRPASLRKDEAPIARVAYNAGVTLGFKAEMGAGSTDANIPMSLGVPAITLDGGGQGRGAHSMTESYDDGDRGYLGPQWVALVVSALAGVRGSEARVVP
ncbi:MAG: N-acetyl-lysine deacetylase [Gemmatimonadaceae bacterium]|nr:N-acetyl-lysine deacetylase [Gemmatimonadaceae bacterium]